MERTLYNGQLDVERSLGYPRREPPSTSSTLPRHTTTDVLPQFLIEKVIRARIYDSIYWKEQCFALTGESLPNPFTTFADPMYLRSDNHHRQSTRTYLHRRCIRRKSETNRVLVVGVEVVGAAAGKGDLAGIPKGGRVQVSCRCILEGIIC